MKAAFAAVLFLTAVLGSEAASTRDGVYSKDQAGRGEAIYKKKCATCHGATLQGIGQARALAGDAFRKKWNGQTLGDLYDDIDSTMPADDPGTLAPAENAETIAYILQVNEFPAGEKDLPADSAELKNIRFDGAPKSSAGTLPKGFPRPVVPADNPLTPAKVEAGRYLFYDKRMSVNGQTACATCHQQDRAFTDGRAHAQGTTGQLHPRSSMSLVNVAFNPSLTWANSTLDSLEEQALIPILGEAPLELGLKGHEQSFLNVVSRDPVYQRLFPQAFPGEANLYVLPNVVKAIAAFERTIVSARSAYDRYQFGHDESALSESAKRGEFLFNSSERAGCFQCHGGWNFSGTVRYEGSKDRSPGSFLNTGVSEYSAPNRGLFEQTRKLEDVGKFRVPTLRNVAVTAPYMHDGSLATLEEVVDHYAAGGRLSHPNKSPVLRKFSLTAQDKKDLVEFLKSLTDEELLRDARWSDPWTSGAGATAVLLK